jgi:hypothetical protein
LSCSRSFFIVLLLSAGAGYALADAPQSQWQSVTLGGDRIGHRQIARSLDDETVSTTETLVLTLQQPGEIPRSSETVVVYTESPRGAPLAVSKSLRSQSASHRMTALVQGERWIVSRKSDENGAETTMPLPERLLFREGVRMALLSLDGEERTLDYVSWSFSSMRFEHYRLQARRLPEGARHSWHLVREPIQPAGAPTELFADEQFFPQVEWSMSGGDEVRIETCDKRCALADFYPVTHVYRQLIRSPVRISEAGLQGRIRYTLMSDFDLQPPETGEQHVTRKGDDWQLDICADCGQEAAATEAERARALAPNYWIAADNDNIQAQVKTLLGGNNAVNNIPEAMAALTRFVSLHMNRQPDYSGYATAAEAFASRNGDCTEHALLLAAMARASGIPARVAVGMVYSNERFLGRKYIFVPHAWVQIWDGERWQSYDSGLGDFTAGYITLGFSDGELSDMTRINEHLHRINIVSAVQVVPRNE